MLLRGDMTESAAREDSDGAPLAPPESHRCRPPNVPRVRSVCEPSCGGIWIVSSLSSRGSIVYGASDVGKALFGDAASFLLNLRCRACSWLLGFSG